MSEMVERVATALDKSLPDQPSQADLVKAAHAMIEAMLEPTAEMVKAGTISWDPMDGGPIRPMFEPTKPYQAMIKAALR